MLIANTISLQRGTKSVIEGFSLALASGELALVTGANGAGKTTLLRGLGGMLPLAGGTLLRTVTCCAIGSVPAVKDGLTVSEHRGFWERLHGNPPPSHEIRGLPELHPPFPLPAAETLGKTLSSGQKQRLHLSRLWQSRAPLWLLDEPLNALDAEAVRDFEAALSAHLAKGGAAVVASHQPLTLAPTHRLHLLPAARTGDPAQDPLAAW